MEICDFKSIDLENVYRDLDYQVAPPNRPFTAINMVSTVDGKATIGGKGELLGSRVDREVMRRVRAPFDALMYGAGTLRVENVNPRVPVEIAEARQAKGMAPQLLRVVISASGVVPLENRFFQLPGAEPVIFTTSQAGEANIEKLKKVALVFVVGDKHLDLRQAMLILTRELGVRSVLAEGGPSLNHSLFKEGLVDEMFVTLAPKVVGGQKARTIVEGPEFLPDKIAALELISVYRSDSELYLRYRVSRGQEASS